MKQKKVNTNLVLAIMLLAGLLGYALLVQAGNLEPSAPPGPTMKTPNEIHEAIASVSPSISQREGYCKYISMPGNTTTTILTVPAGRRFVLRKLWVYYAELAWTIQGGPNLYIDASIFYINSGSASERSLMWDFPDGCAVVEGPNDLTFNSSLGADIKTHIVGYFYDI